MIFDPRQEFIPLPPIAERGLRFSLPEPLALLPGRWIGHGFNVIWRPNSTPGHDRFLELNLTEETLEFTPIPGEIPNRGLLQHDIVMRGLTYFQRILDRNIPRAVLHIEPGIWATVPETQHPAEPPTVVRMASIPHGTTVLAQGTSGRFDGAPTIPDADITPFVIGNAAAKRPFIESDLSTPSQFRSPPAQIAGISQGMVDNPNSVLAAALLGQIIGHTTILEVSSSTCLLGGGVANTAFLQGNPAEGPNAQTALVEATFWIERVQGVHGHPDFYQLQYTQRVLLNFNGLSWPHISVATLRKP